MTPAQKYLAKIGLSDNEPDPIEKPSGDGMPGREAGERSRRSFLKKSALGGLSLRLPLWVAGRYAGAQYFQGEPLFRSFGP
jgi:hypothetical protein